MNDLVNFKENLKDSITNSLLDYINYLHETKQSTEALESGSDALAKCVIMCGALFANKVKKGEVREENIEAFEALLPSEEMLTFKNNGIDFAGKIVKEENAVALSEYQSRFGAVNKSIGQKVA